MIRSGVANLPLHPGKCPRWLFPRMKKLGSAITKIIVEEYGAEEYIRRLSNPFFFQAFGCIMGFDWHSSGLTTTVCGALKEALNSEEYGIIVAGGKGKASKKTPEEIVKAGEKFSISTKKIEKLQYASRTSAKVDNSLIQDGFQLYHHNFFLAENGSWCIIQQGMNLNNKYARRYHWLSGFESFVEEPHSAICSDIRKEEVLDMTSRQSRDARKTSLDLAKEKPGQIIGLFEKIYSEQSSGQKTLSEYFGFPAMNFTMPNLAMPKHHFIPRMNKLNYETLKKAYEFQPQSYEELISIKGLGAKTVRALALISEVIYGSELSWKDPAKFSFAHGGKDGIPYPVDRALMDENTEFLKQAVEQAKLGNKEKINAVRRLRNFY